MTPSRHAIAGLLFLAPIWVHGADYVVAPAGDDNNPGTQAQPFRTIQRAADRLKPGDTCFVRGGTYRETVRPKSSGEAAKPIRFLAWEGEQVVVSGADPLTANWATHRGNILKARTDRSFIQLFAEGKMMPEARWPNTPPGDPMVMNWGRAAQGTDYDTLADPNLPEGDWNNALVLFWPGARWSNYTRRVAGYVPGKSLRFDQTFRPKSEDTYNGPGAHLPQPGNPYVLFGCLAALDSPGEWYLDREQGIIYLWPLSGKTPAEGRIEVKQRALAFDLSGLAFIQLRDVAIFSAALNMTDARHCSVENCRMRYVDHFREFSGDAPAPQNVVTGEDNEWRHCSIGYAAGSALRMGGKGNRLINCIVFGANYLGTYRGGVDLCQSEDAVVRQCTLCRAGRDIIQHHGSKRIRVEYNDLWRANMLNNDSGAIYSWGTDGAGSVIAYNWCHDNIGEATVGIYLDNFCKNFLVHHNLVWNNSGNGITLNSDSLSNLVYNNTLLRNGCTFGVYTYPGHAPTQKGARVINNLVDRKLRTDDPGMFVQGELAPEVHHNGPGATDSRGVPTPGSAAIDAGITVPGVTEGYLGAAPDLGAYEAGGPYWVAGADWRADDMPAALPMDLSFRPRGPVREQSMVTEGLQLWLDAGDEGTLQVDGRGAVSEWRDKSSKGHHAVAGAPQPPTLQKGAMNGKPLLRGSGVSSMSIAGHIRAAEGPATAFVVSQGLVAGGPPWQRLIGSSCGTGDDWVTPNWMVMRPGGGQPAAYPPTVFVVTFEGGKVLDNLTLFGPATKAPQFLTADIAEVLVYDRRLAGDEADAITEYLQAKWGAR